VKVNVLGLTFKENVPDLRNSKVADLCAELSAYGAAVHVHDPLADPAEAEAEYGIRLCAWEQLPKADALVLAVAHRDYQRATEDFLAKLAPDGCVIDVKGALDHAALRRAGVTSWCL
jgi:UDP-N-acetyl-D-galactosamine dehydrogenase